MSSGISNKGQQGVPKKPKKEKVQGARHPPTSNAAKPLDIGNSKKGKVAGARLATAASPSTRGAYSINVS